MVRTLMCLWQGERKGIINGMGEERETLNCRDGLGPRFVGIFEQCRGFGERRAANQMNCNVSEDP